MAESSRAGDAGSAHNAPCSGGAPSSLAVPQGYTLWTSHRGEGHRTSRRPNSG